MISPEILSTSIVHLEQLNTTVIRKMISFLLDWTLILCKRSDFLAFRFLNKSLSTFVLFCSDNVRLRGGGFRTLHCSKNAEPRTTF